jgi:hypothetical protein
MDEGFKEETVTMDEARTILRRKFPDLLIEIEEYLSFAELDEFVVENFQKWREK